MVSWSLAQWRDVSIAWKSNPANQMQPEVLKSVPGESFTGWKLKSFKLSAKYIWSVQPIFFKLHGAMWTVHEVVLRTSLTVHILMFPGLTVHILMYKLQWTLYSVKRPTTGNVLCWSSLHGFDLFTISNTGTQRVFYWVLHENGCILSSSKGQITYTTSQQSLWTEMIEPQTKGLTERLCSSLSKFVRQRLRTNATFIPEVVFSYKHNPMNK